MARPSAAEYAPFYETYVSKVPEQDLLEALQQSLTEIHEKLERIPVDKVDHAYAPGKWTIRTLLQHMIDTERVFSYRAIAFARGEEQGLPGFDENRYADASMEDAPGRNFSEMKEELLDLRRSVYLMYKGFSEKTLTRTGKANNNPVSVNALGYIIIGHVRHHLSVIEERYLR